MRFLIFIIILILGLASCQEVSDVPNSKITIIYTSDEHGWYHKNEKNSGFPGMARLWNEIIQNEGKDNVLILSGGDNFTGYSTSNITYGKNMIKMMNKLNYDFSVIGNHEFDFDIPELKKRISEAEFKYLSANIIDKTTKKNVDFVKPYEIVAVGNSKIAIIGLSNINTSTLTFPPYVEDLEFIDYCDAVKMYIDEIQSHDPDLIIALTHVPSISIEERFPCINEYGIDLILCGHSHQRNIYVKDGHLVVEPGAYLNSFAQIRLEIDNNNNKVIDNKAIIIENKGQIDEEISDYADIISQESLQYLDIVIGRSDSTYEKNSIKLSNLLNRAWLEYYSDADISMANNGGIRQAIFDGEITNGDILGILPFENKIVEIDILGKDLMKELREDHSKYYGLDTNNIEYNKQYKVLINNYMYYADGDFETYDKDPKFHYENYRIPVIKWITSKTDSGRVSLDIFLD